MNWERQIPVVLREAKGLKLTAEQICTRLGVDAGARFNPSPEFCEVIRVLAKLKEYDRIQTADVSAESHDPLYWIDPPREAAHV